VYSDLISKFPGHPSGRPDAHADFEASDGKTLWLDVPLILLSLEVFEVEECCVCSSRLRDDSSESLEVKTPLPPLAIFNSLKDPDPLLPTLKSSIRDASGATATWNPGEAPDEVVSLATSSFAQVPL
jgi:hypothetical protein